VGGYVLGVRPDRPGRPTQLQGNRMPEIICKSSSCDCSAFPPAPFAPKAPPGHGFTAVGKLNPEGAWVFSDCVRTSDFRNVLCLPIRFRTICCIKSEFSRSHFSPRERTPNARPSGPDTRPSSAAGSRQTCRTSRPVKAESLPNRPRPTGTIRSPGKTMPEVDMSIPTDSRASDHPIPNPLT
jgi:hypothetical protein